MTISQAGSLTTAGTGGAAVKNRYYDQLFLRIAQSKLVHKQLGQLNRSIPSGVGGYGTGVVYWTKWINLADVTAGQGEGFTTTAVPLSSLNVTGSTAQYDNAVSVSDLLAYTSFGDVMKAAMERLAYNAGLSIDKIVRNTVSISGTLQSATGVAGAAYTSIPVTGTLSISEIKRAVRTLHRNDAMELPDGFYVSVVHPDALYDLQSDTTTGGWIDANKYTDSNASKLLQGEVGKIHGVRFLQTSNAYQRSAAQSGVTSSSTLYVTSVFGTDAFGVTELQNLKTYVKPFGSSGISDPTDKVATAGWKTTFGANVLNSSFFVNISHTVSSTA